MFNPKSIALVGASEESGKLGYILFRNLIEGGFKGPVYPVNPKAKIIQGTYYPNLETSEFSIVVGDPWQGKGLGKKLLEMCIGIAKEKGGKVLWGNIT